MGDRFKHRAAMSDMELRIAYAKLAASGRQFYLEEWERFSIQHILELRVDDRPPPLRLNDDNEFDFDSYDGEDNA